MRYRREQNHTDTAEKPDIEMYVDQPNVVPIHADEEAAWSLNDMTIDSGDGHVGGNAVAQGAYATRYIPGLIPGHRYKVTLSWVNSLMDITVEMGGTHVVTIQSGQSKNDHVVYVRPVDTGPLRFDHLDVGNFTGGCTKFQVEQMDPIDFDLLPEIKKFGT
jgi:hypothetical protein